MLPAHRTFCFEQVAELKKQLKEAQQHNSKVLPAIAATALLMATPFLDNQFHFVTLLKPSFDNKTTVSMVDYYTLLFAHHHISKR